MTAPGCWNGVGAGGWARRCRAGAQNLTYAKGQNVSPAYEGWEEDSAGRKFFVFGYMNRNWQEELDVPVGPDNRFITGNARPGPADALPAAPQPLHLPRAGPGRVHREGRARVEPDHRAARPSMAFASLRLDYRIDDVVKASETGALGAGSSSPEVRANTPPVLEVQGPRRIEVKVGEAVPLVVTRAATTACPRPAPSAPAPRSRTPARRPRCRPTPPGGKQIEALRARRLMLPPQRVTVGKNVGLHVGWHVYRGAGR